MVAKCEVCVEREQGVMLVRWRERAFSRIGASFRFCTKRRRARRRVGLSSPEDLNIFQSWLDPSLTMNGHGCPFTFKSQAANDTIERWRTAAVKQGSGQARVIHNVKGLFQIDKSSVFDRSGSEEMMNKGGIGMWNSHHGSQPGWDAVWSNRLGQSDGPEEVSPKILRCIPTRVMGRTLFTSRGLLVFLMRIRISVRFQARGLLYKDTG